MQEQKQKQHQQQERHIAIVPDSGTIETSSRRRLIFQVDEGHKSKQTAIKYRNNFDHFLNFIRIQDLDVFLDLGKKQSRSLS